MPQLQPSQQYANAIAEGLGSSWKAFDEGFEPCLRKSRVHARL